MPKPRASIYALFLLVFMSAYFSTLAIASHNSPSEEVENFSAMNRASEPLRRYSITELPGREIPNPISCLLDQLSPNWTNTVNLNAFKSQICSYIKIVQENIEKCVHEAKLVTQLSEMLISINKSVDTSQLTTTELTEIEATVISFYKTITSQFTPDYIQNLPERQLQFYKNNIDMLMTRLSQLYTLRKALSSEKLPKNCVFLLFLDALNVIQRLGSTSSFSTTAGPIIKPNRKQDKLRLFLLELIKFKDAKFINDSLKQTHILDKQSSNTLYYCMPLDITETSYHIASKLTDLLDKYK